MSSSLDYESRGSWAIDLISENFSDTDSLLIIDLSSGGPYVLMRSKLSQVLSELALKGPQFVLLRKRWFLGLRLKADGEEK